MFLLEGIESKEQQAMNTIYYILINLCPIQHIYIFVLMYLFKYLVLDFCNYSINIQIVVNNFKNQMETLGFIDIN